MSVKIKRLVNPYEERMLEFLQTCVDENYKIHTQVSLCQFCELDSNLDIELRKFFFTSSVDALITNSDYKPCLVVDFQSSYHDYPETRERDRKKATLLALAAVPLLYSRVKDFGLLHLYSQSEEVVCNLFTGNRRENAQALIRNYCKQSFSADVRVTAL
ncbi:DUF2726 domain-containing protein [Nostoc sp. 'Peltigera membranacea cyanobiont' 232]|uniref:DUF2726 domain-containing protein n=2 Tax=unclassified Nostoc TaxID=2593658 RepID=UPI000B95C06A|nr:DUF2726 domain-containing protein [Nostoc sp. 'Peltigera membranacea cyanobiont' 232]OYE01138.1 hypothetical protein CDG79_31305 [Nostoc sp. 'Peltigera membranacea cyanobiont' 232]